MSGTVYLLLVIVCTFGILGSFMMAPESGEKITGGVILCAQSVLGSLTLGLSLIGFRLVGSAAPAHHLQAMAVFVVGALAGVAMLVDAIRKLSRR
jgi:hypothetical protein